jgi:DNA repair protein RecO (recombination protein O)
MTGLRGSEALRDLGIQDDGWCALLLRDTHRPGRRSLSRHDDPENAVPQHETEAFVLRSYPLGESDRIVTFLTRGAGKVRGVAKGARRSRRRFGSNLELLSRVRLAYFEREGSDLVRVESAELLESFYLLQEDPERGAVLACFAEIADAFAREQQEDEAFFRLLHATLRAVRDGVGLDWAGRYFEIWTLRLHGVLPSLRQCAACGSGLLERGGRLDRRDGSVRCRRCAPDGRDGALPAASLLAAEEILKQPPEAFVGRAADPAVTMPLGSLAETLFFDLLSVRLKSYEILRAIRTTLERRRLEGEQWR